MEDFTQILDTVTSNPLTLTGVLSLITIAIVKGWLIPLTTFKTLEATWKEALEREREISKRLTDSIEVSNAQAELTLDILSKLPKMTDDEQQQGQQREQQQPSAEREEGKK